MRFSSFLAFEIPSCMYIRLFNDRSNFSRPKHVKFCPYYFWSFYVSSKMSQNLKLSWS